MNGVANMIPVHQQKHHRIQPSSPAHVQASTMDTGHLVPPAQTPIPRAPCQQRWRMKSCWSWGCTRSKGEELLVESKAGAVPSAALSCMG